MTVINQRFSLCKLTKIRSMIVEWIKLVESRLNHGITCPLKAGMLEYKGGETTVKAMKEISPMFVISDDKKDSITFLIRITFMSKIRGKMESILQYSEYKFNMSDL
jgi:hypothetical protein